MSAGAIQQGWSAALEAARRIADEILFPGAEDTDRAPVVPASNLDALAEAGLFGLACPPPQVAPAAGAGFAEVHEALAGGCGATTFVWAQHHSPVRLLASSANRGPAEEWLGRLCSGQAIAGVAFSHMRRPGPPAVEAERAPGGWRVRGEAPWVTSWGIAQVFAVAAVCGGDAVWFCLRSPLHNAHPALRPSPPLTLAVLQPTSTVRLGFEDLFVPDEDVLRVEPVERWKRRDRVATLRPSAAALGVAGRCCRLLAEMDRHGAPETAEALSAELAACKAAGAGLEADEDLPLDTATAGGTGGTEPLERLAEMAAVRAWGLELANRAALALVAAAGGEAMVASHPAQRLAREAMFYQVQAQTEPVRLATLARLAPGTRAKGWRR